MNQFTAALLSVILALVIFFTFTGRHGVFHLGNIRSELVALEQKNKELEQEIIELHNKIYSIRNNKFALEKKAREELGLSQNGETVYLFTEENK